MKLDLIAKKIRINSFDDIVNNIKNNEKYHNNINYIDINIGNEFIDLLLDASDAIGKLFRI